jgi:hypothetical protein
MKAKVLWKFNGKVKLKMENGDILHLGVAEATALNSAMRQGDEGEIVHLPNGKTKFRIFADEVLPMPKPPDTIPIPTIETDDNA